MHVSYNIISPTFWTFYCSNGKLWRKHVYGNWWNSSIQVLSWLNHHSWLNNANCCSNLGSDLDLLRQILHQNDITVLSRRCNNLSFSHNMSKKQFPGISWEMGGSGWPNDPPCYRQIMLPHIQTFTMIVLCMSWEELICGTLLGIGV